MDVEYACNSVLNAIEVAEALGARQGRCRDGPRRVRRSAPSRAVRWGRPRAARPTCSPPRATPCPDAGAAVLVRRATAAEADARDGSGAPAPRGILRERVRGRVDALGRRHACRGRHRAPASRPRAHLLRDRRVAAAGRVPRARAGGRPRGRARPCGRLIVDGVALVAVHQVAVAYLDDVPRPPRSACRPGARWSPSPTTATSPPRRSRSSSRDRARDGAGRAGRRRRARRPRGRHQHRRDGGAAVSTRRFTRGVETSYAAARRRPARARRGARDRGDAGGAARPAGHGLRPRRRGQRVVGRHRRPRCARPRPGA